MTKQLQQLHERFIEKANRPMTFGSLPVTPKEAVTPIIAVNRWTESNGALYKTYVFRRMSDRSQFVIDLMIYEGNCGHHADIRVNNDVVTLKLQTSNVNHVTEFDREYARYADITFKDIVYSPDASL